MFRAHFHPRGMLFILLGSEMGAYLA